MNEKKVVLVTGATGRQGSHTVRQLLKRGFVVRAFVRDKSKAVAQELKKLGAHLVEGSFDDDESMKRALEGADGAFLVTPADPSNQSGNAKEIEVAYGVTFVEHCKTAGVKHLVFTSSSLSGERSDVPFLDSKREIEEHIRQSGLTYTILRPVAFMENFNEMWMRGDNVYIPLDSNVNIPFICSKDIGEFAAISFDKPADFKGKTLVIAADMLTPPQAAKIFSQALGREIKSEQQPIEELAFFSQALVAMFKKINERGFVKDMAEIDFVALRKINPDLWTLEDWLKHQPFKVAAAPRLR